MKEWSRANIETSKTEEDWIDVLVEAVIAVVAEAHKPRVFEKEPEVERVALYSTIHRGSIPFLPAWYRSVAAQTDQSFDLWLGIDEVTPSEISSIVGVTLQAKWTITGPGFTPSQLRNAAIQELVRQYEAVVFVDSDDLLEPGRVASARTLLETHDVTACSMRLINESGEDLGRSFCWPRQDDWTLLASSNAFGLGNSAYRCEALKSCLPIPGKCVMEDWFLVTRCWTQRMRLHFDQACGMAYRQHRSNMTAVYPPFSVSQLTRTVRDVLVHYQFALQHIPELRVDDRRELERARRKAEQFERAVLNDWVVLQRYLFELNRLPADHIWFDCVAHPALDRVWDSSP